MNVVGIGVWLHRRHSSFLLNHNHVQLATVPEDASDLAQEPLTQSWKTDLSYLWAFDAFHQLYASWSRMMHRIREDVQAIDPNVINLQIKQTVRHARMMSIILPFASASSGIHSLVIVTKAISSFISVYLLLLFVRVLLSWFPTFRWDRNPWIILRQVTDPYLNLFRGLIPPLLGTIDFTPLLGFIILQWLSGNLVISDEEAYW